MPDPNSEDTPFGQQLRQLRRTKKLTLKDVEAMTGIHNAYLSQVENGKIARPAPDKLYALAEVYGVSFDQLMYAAGHITKQPHAEPQGNEPKTLVGAVLSSKNLTAEEEAKLAEYLEFLRARK
ncbi:helix-turn-helix domain-containing protein [Deinococcus aestuarii]|uniref:helix-turn-helix domain-containing protein n=1 Tax=Deinococcus aestuarii TaxID=2774531 RepID=UPI001C0C7E1E|nr:helix-turn-helix transcriptional regulator [Deinococcus aestuarii]